MASRGRFDPRPVLMIHFPGQQAEHDVSAPFDEIRIHEMIERMLRGQDPAFDKALLAGSEPLDTSEIALLSQTSGWAPPCRSLLEQATA